MNVVYAVGLVSQLHYLLPLSVTESAATRIIWLRLDGSAEKRIQYDEKELRHRVRLGTRQKLDELMTWNSIEEINEVVQNLIPNAHTLWPALSFQAIESPRHKVQISENVARMFRK